MQNEADAPALGLNTATDVSRMARATRVGVVYARLCGLERPARNMTRMPVLVLVQVVKAQGNGIVLNEWRMLLGINPGSVFANLGGPINVALYTKVCAIPGEMGARVRVIMLASSAGTIVS
jgi:hypothetical protein